MVNAGHSFAIALFPLLLFAGYLVVLATVIIVLWRGMKAHESIADSLRQIANK